MEQPPHCDCQNNDMAFNHPSLSLFVPYSQMASTEKQLLGTETVSALRASGVDCTICGLSANDMEHEFLEAGADHFVLKPLPRVKSELEAELVHLTSGIRAKQVVKLQADGADDGQV